MATTTPNFGWPVPTSTDLVKDGATAIEALGDAIDASLVDLEGGTTGQILAKASNTDMDFAWITNDVGDITAVTAGTGISGGGTSGAVTITNSMATAIDAKGDLVAGTGADTFARLAVGANTAPLLADSAQSTGLRWDNDVWASYTPTWTSSGTQPVLGNGTITGRWKQRGKVVDFRIQLFLGSTSTIGTGNYFLGLPIQANANQLGNINSRGYAVDVSAGGFFHIFGDSNDGSAALTSRLVVTSGAYGTLDTVGAVAPFTFANGDSIQVIGTYEVVA
jgi:hypothetical protein